MRQFFHQRFALIVLILALTACAPGGDPTQFDGVGATEVAVRDAEAVRMGKLLDTLISQSTVEVTTPTVLQYVRRVGERITAVSAQAGQPWSFRVLMHPAIVGTARPNGVVEVSTGMLSLLSTEDELAAVLAHEIAHLNLNHASIRVAHVGRVGFDDASLAERMALAQKLELEADALAVRYLAAAGYNPMAVAEIMQLFDHYGRRSGAKRPDPHLMRHPPATARADAARVEAAMFPAAPSSRDSHLDAIDGLEVSTRTDWLISEHRLIQPWLGVYLNRILDFPLERFLSVVVDANKAPGYLWLDHVADPGGDLDSHVLTHLIPLMDSLDEEVTQPAPGTLRTEPVTINGIDMLRTSFRIADDPSGESLRAIAFRRKGRIMRHLLIADPANDALWARFEESVQSIRPVAESYERAVRPIRLKVVRVKPGDTADALARRSINMRGSPEQFLRYNGLAPDAPLQPGARVKLLTR